MNNLNLHENLHEIGQGQAPLYPPQPSPSKAASRNGPANQTEGLTRTTFDAIKSRISQDNVKKIKIRAPRWLRGKIQKQRMEPRLFTNKIVKAKTEDAGKKNTRNLNIRSRVNLMEKFLQKQGFSDKQIKLILCEYKMKLKEEDDVRDAVSFFKYVQKQGEKEINKPLLELHKKPHKKPFEEIVEKFNVLDKQKFEEIDKTFVERFSGKEKSVYVHDTLAVSTAKASLNPYKALKNKKILKKEYEMTLDIRVNAMERELKKSTLLKLNDREIKTILILYRHELESQNEITNASSFFNALRNKPGLYCKLFNQNSLEHFDMLEGLGKAIDQSISGIDTDRKKVEDQGKTYYKSAKALGDLKYFLSSDKMKNLSLEEFTELMNSFDDLQKSMKNAGLLHGDIKPDNIFVYEERTKEGKIIYKFKISDFGKSQWNTAKKMHAGQDSLNMIKLLILNATTPPKGSEQDQTEYANLPKVSDIAYRSMDLGHLRKEGIKRYNYFSSATSGDVSASIDAWFTRKAERDRMRKNTEASVISFLKIQETEHRAKLEKERPSLTLAEKRKELREEQLYLTRRKMSFELLQSMYPSSQYDYEAEILNCDTCILSCKEKLKNLGGLGPTKVAPTRLGKTKHAPEAELDQEEEILPPPTTPPPIDKNHLPQSVKAVYEELNAVEEEIGGITRERYLTPKEAFEYNTRINKIMEKANRFNNMYDLPGFLLKNKKSISDFEELSEYNNFLKRKYNNIYKLICLSTKELGGLHSDLQNLIQAIKDKKGTPKEHAIQLQRLESQFEVLKNKHLETRFLKPSLEEARKLVLSTEEAHKDAQPSEGNLKIKHPKPSTPYTKRPWTQDLGHRT